VELVTFVYCIYQHRCSRDCAVFLSLDRVTLDGMPHNRKCTIRFCTHHHRIDVAKLSKCCSEIGIFLTVMPKRCSPQKSAYCYRRRQLYVHGKSTLAIVVFVKLPYKALNKSRKMFVRKIFFIVQQIKYWNCSVHLLLRHGYCLLQNIKSIRQLVMLQDNK
jgi:hypothetical protein